MLLVLINVSSQSRVTVHRVLCTHSLTWKGTLFLSHYRKPAMTDGRPVQSLHAYGQTTTSQRNRGQATEKPGQTTEKPAVRRKRNRRSDDRETGGQTTETGGQTTEKPAVRQQRNRRSDDVKTGGQTTTTTTCPESLGKPSRRQHVVSLSGQLQGGQGRCTRGAEGPAPRTLSHGGV